MKMSTIKETITKNVDGKIVLLLLVITNSIYALMLVVTIPKTMTFSDGMKLLDMMPAGYDTDYVYTLFEKLGANGRDVYLKSQIPVDMVYPFLFGISYSLLMAYLLEKLNMLNSIFFHLCFLPIIAGLADYVENIGIINMLNNYPNLSQGSIDTTNVFSIVKSTTTTIYVLGMVITLLLYGIKIVRTRANKSQNVNGC